MSLASRWLDLDRIAGADEGAGPLESIVPLAVGMRDLLPAEGRSRATFTIDQANVGRESVSGLRLSLARSERQARRSRSCASACRAAAAASCKAWSPARPKRPPSTAASACAARAWCASLGWATAGACDVRSAQGRRHFRRARAAVDRRRAAPLRATSSATCPAPRSAAARNTAGRAGPELSLMRRGPAARCARLHPRRRRALATSSTSSCTARSAIRAGACRRQGGLARRARPTCCVRVNAGQLITAARTYRDVAMEIELKGGRLRLPLLRVTGDDGFSLELEGEIDDATARPKAACAAPSPPIREPPSARLRSCWASPTHFVPTCGGRRPWCHCAWPGRSPSVPARRRPPTWCSTERSTARAPSSMPASMAVNPAGAPAPPT